jgi:hypothetical protein
MTPNFGKVGPPMNNIQTLNPLRFSSGGILYRQFNIGNDETGVAKSIYRILDRYLPVTLRDDTLIPSKDAFEHSEDVFGSSRDADLLDVFTPSVKA